MSCFSMINQRTFPFCFYGKYAAKKKSENREESSIMIRPIIEILEKKGEMPEIKDPMKPKCKWK